MSSTSTMQQHHIYSNTTSMHRHHPNERKQQKTDFDSNDRIHSSDACVLNNDRIAWDARDRSFPPSTPASFAAISTVSVSHRHRTGAWEINLDQTPPLAILISRRSLETTGDSRLRPDLQVRLKRYFVVYKINWVSNRAMIIRNRITVLVDRRDLIQK